MNRRQMSREGREFRYPTGLAGELHGPEPDPSADPVPQRSGEGELPAIQAMQEWLPLLTTFREAVDPEMVTAAVARVSRGMVGLDRLVAAGSLAGQRAKQGAGLPALMGALLEAARDPDVYRGVQVAVGVLRELGRMTAR